jgi:hypothetical protein
MGRSIQDAGQAAHSQGIQCSRCHLPTFPRGWTRSRCSSSRRAACLCKDAPRPIKCDNVSQKPLSSPASTCGCRYYYRGGARPGQRQAIAGHPGKPRQVACNCPRNCREPQRIVSPVRCALQYARHDEYQVCLAQLRLSIKVILTFQDAFVSSAIIDYPQKACEAISDTTNVRSVEKCTGTKPHQSVY